jgi:hydrogenase expression/formation protein HypC
MCLSDLGRVVNIDEARHSASVDIGDHVIQVSTVTLGLDSPPPAVGDWLVIHTGFAVERLTEAAAADIRQARRGLTPPTLELDPKERP